MLYCSIVCFSLSLNYIEREAEMEAGTARRRGSRAANDLKHAGRFEKNSQRHAVLKHGRLSLSLNYIEREAISPARAPRTPEDSLKIFILMLC